MRETISAEAALAAIAWELSARGGRDHYHSCARRLAEVLGVNQALFAEFGDAPEARVLGYWSEDGRTPPAVSIRPGSSWANIVEQGANLQRQALLRHYPTETSLAAVGADSLAARVLRDAAGLPTGLVAVLDTSPLEWTTTADAILTLFAAHAESLIRGSRSERLLSHVAAQWTETLDAMPEFVAVIDPTHRLLRVNRALARQAFSHPRELIGRKCHSVLHGLDQPWPGCPHEEALREGRSVSREVFDPRVGLPLQITCTPLLAAGGTPFGTVHVARDISEQTQASQLRERLIEDLQEALSKVNQLSGMLPICAWCKRIRNDQGYWAQVEDYIREHSEASFTHGVCPECVKTHYPELQG